MTKVLFSEMSLTPKVERAVSLMGFDSATPIQSEAIPVIRTGVDVIARSQTGTGKTLAFAIPAIERVDTHEEKPTIQVLVLCPTRELAVQGEEEIRKLARFKEGIRPIAIYGGASIEQQCIGLRRANIVVGTPGRIMDHMRRKTIKLGNLKIIVLDEADEMLNMGFKEDIETILSETPAERQTIMFSATMPPAIMKITKEFQRDPVLIEIDKSQVTIENIEQRFIDVPHANKKEALLMLLKFYQPKRAIIFCGTKKMTDELSDFLNGHDVSAESIHSDIKQTQRTTTMRDFKAGKTTILIATDIAARGIDVSDVEYVINFDIPPNTEYYVHRIGRTGRAGKDGCSITICSSKREVNEIRQIAVAVKSQIKELPLPTPEDITAASVTKAISEIETLIQGEISPVYTEMLNILSEKGLTPQNIAEAALSLCYPDLAKPLSKMPVTQIKHETGELQKLEPRSNVKRDAPKPKPHPLDYAIILIDIGASSGIKANHIIGAVTDRTGISGKEIGKVDISVDQSLVEVPSQKVDEILQSMQGCKICGKMTHSCLLAGSPRKLSRNTNTGSAAKRANLSKSAGGNRNNKSK
ncbi:MAG: DEAD/DEAH box helicase [Clostridia bacterium]|nr:DEAD/DEAH box helicase [Clostridia bacterium]